MNSIKKSSELVSSKFLVKSPISIVNEVLYTVWTASACLHCFEYVHFLYPRNIIFIKANVLCI